MTALPQFLIGDPRATIVAEEPELGTDPLSAVLQAVRMKGAIYFLVDATAPWAVEAPRAAELLPTIMPGVQHLLEYHVITRGEVWGGLPGRPPLKLVAGDAIVFPQGDGHVLGSAPGLRKPLDLDALLRQPRGPLPLRVGGAAPGAGEIQLVCGFLGCDARPFNPLLEALPRVLHLRGGAHGHGDAFGALVQLALAESQRRGAGSGSVLARVSELLFIESIRSCLGELGPDESGWLAGLRDPQVGRALTQLHARPQQAWTLEGLARAASTSRSVLVERFTHFVGLPPMQYLARWRMQLASSALLEGNPSVAEVALQVGYGSEAAFSRAFKKLVGRSPAAWREQHSSAARPSARRGRGRSRDR